jgi:hypothetical protein
MHDLTASATQPGTTALPPLCRALAVMAIQNVRFIGWSVMAADGRAETIRLVTAQPVLAGLGRVAFQIWLACRLDVF